MNAEDAYREVVARRDRLQREWEKLVIAAVPGQPDTTKDQRQEIAQEIERLYGRMWELIAERKARDASQPTKGGE